MAAQNRALTVGSPAIAVEKVVKMRFVRLSLSRGCMVKLGDGIRLRLNSSKINR